MIPVNSHTRTRACAHAYNDISAAPAKIYKRAFATNDRARAPPENLFIGQRNRRPQSICWRTIATIYTAALHRRIIFFRDSDVGDVHNFLYLLRVQFFFFSVFKNLTELICLFLFLSFFFFRFSPLPSRG